MAQHETIRDRILEYARKHPDEKQTEIAKKTDTNRNYVSEVLIDFFPEHSSVRKKTHEDRIADYLHEHPEAYREDLWKEFDINRSQIREICNRMTGYAVEQPDHKRRKQEVKELLAVTPPLHVQEIAERVGCSRTLVRTVQRESIHK